MVQEQMKSFAALKISMNIISIIEHSYIILETYSHHRVTCDDIYHFYFCFGLVGADFRFLFFFLLFLTQKYVLSISH